MKFKVGQLVVVRHSPDAAIFRIVEIDGFRIGVIDAELSVDNQAIQWHDKGIFKTPTEYQLEYVQKPREIRA